MNLIEAINSGRPFRRPCFPEGLWYEYVGAYVTMTRSDGLQYQPDKYDILADDWEIQEPSVPITLSQYWKTVGELFKTIGSRHAALTWEGMEELAHKLGLDGKK